MGFNYLQTDDRDDYFAQFGSKKEKTKVLLGIDLINPNGETILTCAPMWKVRSYAKKNYIKRGQGAKYIWRKILTDNGYTVKNIFADNSQSSK
jgi:hypothetical protein